jgi:hypothetical protein
MRCFSASTRSSFAAFAPRSALSMKSLASASPGVNGRSELRHQQLQQTQRRETARRCDHSSHSINTSRSWVAASSSSVNRQEPST